jgi:hypothetical protein
LSESSSKKLESGANFPYMSCVIIIFLFLDSIINVKLLQTPRKQDKHSQKEYFFQIIQIEKQWRKEDKPKKKEIEMFSFRES